MIVYWEYAFAENALLDGLLLYLAEKCARMKVRVFKLLLSACLGGAFAVLYPLFSLPSWAGYMVKFLFGVVMALVAAEGKQIKPYLVMTCAFFALTFAFGGILTAVYSFFGIETIDGTGFYLERVPVAFVLSGAGIFAVLVLAGSRAYLRYRHVQKNLFRCKLSTDEKTCLWTGYADSGNCLTFRGAPVCVISAAGVFALFGAHPRAIGHMTVTTVNGSRSSPVFCCRRLELDGVLHKNVCLTVGEIGTHFQILLHTALTEGVYEHTGRTQTVASKNWYGRKRRTLSLRERSASVATFSEGRGGTSAEVGREQGSGDGQGKTDRA